MQNGMFFVGFEILVLVDKEESQKRSSLRPKRVDRREIRPKCIFYHLQRKVSVVCFAWHLLFYLERSVARQWCNCHIGKCRALGLSLEFIFSKNFSASSEFLLLCFAAKKWGSL